MQPYYKPEILVLKGEDAIQVLNKYVKELEEGQAEELTKKQAKAMVKLTKGLIKTIEAETRTQEPVRNTNLLLKLRETIRKYVPQTLQEPTKPIQQGKVLSSRTLPYHPPPMTQQFK